MSKYESDMRGRIAAVLFETLDMANVYVHRQIVDSLAQQVYYELEDELRGPA